MERIPVDSTDLKSVEYDKNKKLLEVEFINKRSVYQYSNVPEHVHFELMNAPSIGHYFSSRIRDNLDYGCRQVFPIQRFVR
ncbi:MAG: KTSC domain-containing protein [Synergistaceae bacterium]|nr:KTSC domain-containing protein [Synergistaceae bacterium]